MDFASLQDFHFLRPLWLLGLLPVLALFLGLWRLRARPRDWQALIDADLLPFLTDNPGGRRRHRWPLWGLLGAWILACLALAGPTWEQRPVPVLQSEQALALLLDLGPSMRAADVNPSRLVRARMKVNDALRQRQEGVAALVAYGGDAHVVSPFTDDSNTIVNLLNVLEPELMPLPGSAADRAVQEAVNLFRNAGIPEGEILLVTDGVSAEARRGIERALSGNRYRLSILGVGTPEGAPFPGQQGFVRDNQGQVLIARLQEEPLRELARRHGGRYHRVTADNSDLEWLTTQAADRAEGFARQLEREFDQWLDRGHWLLLLLLPLLLWCFRRGTLAALLFAPLLLLGQGPGAQASPWLTPDQQGQRLLQDNPEAAADTFAHPEWRGTARYRAGDYAGAVESFAQSDSARAHYNRGNALARLGELQAALDAYDQALARQPDHEDAAANRRLIEQLKEQQQEQQDGQGDSQPQPDDGEQQENGEPGQNDQTEGDDSRDDSRRDGRDEDFDSGADDDAAEEEQSEDDTADQADAADEQMEDPATAEQPAQPEDGDAEDAQPQPLAVDFTDEERQELEQWLRRIPDDPGGLLRRKFQYEHQQRAPERRQQQWQERFHE